MSGFLLGDDGDGNSLSDGLNIIAVDGVSGTLFLHPGQRNDHHKNMKML